MYFLNRGGIPKRGLPLNGWPNYGIPGAPDVPADEFPSGGGTGARRREAYYPDGRDLLGVLEEYKRKQILRDDQEFMELLTMILKAGILD
jgi:hypothetical protein